MLIVEVATDTEVQIESKAEGRVSMSEFVELIDIALMSEDVVNWLKDHIRLRDDPIPWSPVQAARSWFNSRPH
jgi:hypothetical protein